MDVLKLLPRESGDPAQLVSAGRGISVEGPVESLRRLNAALVPAPTFMEVDSKTYICLSPVLRCRWKGQESTGSWLVRFSMADIGGFGHNISRVVSVFRRPTASRDGKWELLHRVDDVEGASNGEDTVSVMVTHFSELVAAVDKATASEKSKGYIILPIERKFLRPVRPVGNGRLIRKKLGGRGHVCCGR